MGKITKIELMKGKIILPKKIRKYCTFTNIGILSIIVNIWVIGIIIVSILGATLFDRLIMLIFLPQILIKVWIIKIMIYNFIKDTL